MLHTRDEDNLKKAVIAIHSDGYILALQLKMQELFTCLPVQHIPGHGMSTVLSEEAQKLVSTIEDLVKCRMNEILVAYDCGDKILH